MITNLVKYTCDKCQKDQVQESRLEMPAAWSNVACRTMTVRRDIGGQTSIYTHGNGFNEAAEFQMNSLLCPTCTEALQNWLSIP